VTLTQFQDLKAWHLRQGQAHPLEKHCWDSVLTLWMIGWVGAPVALVLQQPAVAVACLMLLFLPSRYVALRRRLHIQHRLRCDWLSMLR
jgi:hypothetical protein